MRLSFKHKYLTLSLAGVMIVLAVTPVAASVGQIVWQFNLNDGDAATDGFDISVGPGGGIYVVGHDWSDESGERRRGLYLVKYRN